MSEKELSNAEIIRIFTRELLDDCMMHTAKEIKEYTENQMNSRHREYSYVNQDKETGRWFTDGNYAGALRDLISKEKEYIQCGRGLYRKTSYIYKYKEGRGLYNTIDDALDNAIDNIKENVKIINPLEINDETYMAIKKANTIISELEKLRIEVLELM